MTADIPNAFLQTGIDQSGEKVIMKIKGVLVDMLVELDPVTFQDYVYEYKKGKKAHKVIYVRMLKALYGMLVSSLLHYKKFVSDITGIGFEINPYDPCVANRIVNNKQHTVTWHVDDLKSSHVDPRVNNKFHKWLEKTYGEDGIGEVKCTRGNIHDYLAMGLDFSLSGALRLNMVPYVKGMCEDFPGKLYKVSCPWTATLFQIDDKAKLLDEPRQKDFHTFVMKGMFVCKRARQDILPGIVFLSTRTSEPTTQDWKKLVRIMSFLNETLNDVVTLEADDTTSTNWHIDSAFAVHYDFKSHTGATLTLGKGTCTSVSTKQKINTRSSTEAELVGTDDVVAKVLWTKLFLEAQGFTIKNVAHRDNTSTMKLEENGKASSGKRTRHFNIKYFYITDLIKRKEVSIIYCPTDDMIGDYMTKPLVGAKFQLFRSWIMNMPQLVSRSVLAASDMALNPVIKSDKKYVSVKKTKNTDKKVKVTFKNNKGLVGSEQSQI